MELFVTDLDGTLLDKNKNISDFSKKIINNFIEEGNLFTVATARSLSSAKDILKPLKLNLPIILNNGGFIYDPINKKNLVSNYINEKISEKLIDFICCQGYNPFVHLEDQGENKLYYRKILNQGEQIYYEGRLRRGDKRFTQVKKFELKDKKVITCFLIGPKEELTELYNKLNKKFKEVQLHLFWDLYSKHYWLEINSLNATKENGIIFLKKFLNISNVSCFGDNLNDLSMFSACDNKYAVRNAHNRVKELATDIIGSNIENGVAKFIESRRKK